MKNVLKKLFEAKQIIKNTKIKKEGKNDFSKYSYFTPSQISELISDACSQVNCVTKFDLIRNELGIFGKLYFIDCESSEQIEFEMASAIPEIKATNIAQQLGGAVTYTHRYLLTTAFDIVDNSLDFDTTENTKNQNKPSTQQPISDENAKFILNSSKTMDELKANWSKLSKNEQSLPSIVTLKEMLKNNLTPKTE